MESISRPASMCVIIHRPHHPRHPQPLQLGPLNNASSFSIRAPPQPPPVHVRPLWETSLPAHHPPRPSVPSRRPSPPNRPPSLHGTPRVLITGVALIYEGWQGVGSASSPGDTWHVSKKRASAVHVRLRFEIFGV